VVVAESAVPAHIALELVLVPGVQSDVSGSASRTAIQTENGLRVGATLDVVPNPLAGNGYPKIIG